MVATPTKGQSIHNMFDPSLQSMLHQLPGHIIPQTVWKPTKGYTPALLPQDFLFRVQRPGPPTANGPTITVGPPSLKEAERLSVVRMLMLDEYCADHVPKEITIVVEWPEHRSFRVQITRPPLERCWSLSLLAHEISAVMRQWRKGLGANTEEQDAFLRAIYLVQCREVATNVWQPVFARTLAAVKREPSRTATASQFASIRTPC